MKATIDTDHTDWHAGDAKLLASFMKHRGETQEVALSILAVSGLRRLAALDRHGAQSWAGKADPTHAAPFRKGKGKHKAGK